MNFAPRTALLARLALLTGLTSPLLSIAATPITWGNSGTAWVTNANWLGGTAPANDLTTAIALFNSATFAAQPNFGTTSVNGLAVGDGTNATGPLTLTGTALSLGDGGITINASAGTVSLANSVKLGASQSWANNSSSLFTVGAAISNIGNATPFTLTLNGNGSGGTNLSGVISNGGTTGTTALVVNTTGTGVTTLSGANTFTGGLTLTAGVLRATVNSSPTTVLGSGALSLGGGELQLASTGTTAFNNNTTVTGNTQITSDRTVANNAGSTYTLGTLSIGAQTLSIAAGSNVTSGTAGITFTTTTLTGNAILDVTDAPGSTLTLLTLGATTLGTNALTVQGSGNTSIGAITGTTGTVTKTGTGQLTLTGLNTYTGLTTVNNGTLYLNRPGVSGSILTGNVLVTGAGVLTASNVADQFGTAPTTNITVNNGGTWNLGVGSATSGQSINALTIGSPSDSTGTQSKVEALNTLKITGAGSNILNLQGSSAVPAVLSLGGYGQAISTINLTNTTLGTTTTVNFGANSRILSGGAPAGSGNGAIYSTATATASNYVTFNFNGTTLSTPNYTGAAAGTPGSLYYNQVRVGDTSAQTTGYFDKVNLNASLGDGTGWLQVIKSQINLGWTGTLNLGALVTTRDVNVGNAGIAADPSSSSNPVTILNTATGMTGGQIYGAGNLANGPGVSSTFTSLLFQSGTSAQTFTLGTDTSGVNLANNTGLIDVRARNTATGAGGITQNNINLDISGGVLRGNTLVDSTSAGNGTVTIENGGELTLASDTGVYTISTTAVGANNRTIYMKGSGAGTFTLGGAGTSAISVVTQTGSGTWSGGTINANGGHTISDGTGGLSTTSTAAFITGYTFAANSGLNGIAMANAAPFATSAAGAAPTVRMTLGDNSSFFAKNATTATGPVTYYIGQAGTLAALAPTSINNVGIATAATGNLMFGSSQANNTQGSLGASALAYTGGNTATLTLPSTPTTYGLSVGNVIILAGASGTNREYYTGTFVITGISGNVVTFALNAVPPNTTIPATSSATLRNEQNLVLLRDKGAANISLLANASGGEAHVASDQTGSGNLYINATGITLDQGVSFGGTGGIYSGTIVPGSGWTNLGGSALGVSSVGAYGSLNGSANGNTLLVVNGALGTSVSDSITVSLNPYNGNGANGGSSGIYIGEAATLQGTQKWTVASTSTNDRLAPLFANRLTNAASWNASVSLTIQGQYGLIEASTSTSAPSLSSNYQFTDVTIAGVGGSNVGVIKLTNNVQNDGGSSKEALYAGTFTATAADGSGGTFLLNLNGQDLYANAFTVSLGKGVSFVNDALNSTSVIRNFGNPVTSAPLAIGGFRVMNGAAIETQAGNWYSMVWNRNVGTFVADTAAAPNGALAEDVKQTLRWDNTFAVGSGASSFTSFLGSGTATGSNAGTNAAGTDGTFRVLGGKFQASNYILNPVGSNGTISTIGTGDTTLNDVIIRANASQAVTAASGSLWLTLGTEQLYSVGDLVVIAAGGGYSAAYYYVVGVNGNQIQVSATPGGAVQAASGTVSGTVSDLGGLSSLPASGNAATPAFIAAGTTNIVGNLILSDAPGAPYQATLRVGGVDPTTGLAHASQGTLNVTGNLSVGATNNLAIQSNGTVKVGGNVDILGVGSNISVLVNGVTGAPTGLGVGINAASHFTLNGNKGAATPQTVNIVPVVGNFHVGDGSAGTLTGLAAQARLAANLTSATGIDINGSASSLDLGGFTLTANGSGLTTGGAITGTGTVAGTTTVINGGSIHSANTVGLLTFSNAVTLNTGSAINIAINGATTRGTDYSGVDFNGALTISGGALTFNFGSAIANGALLNVFGGSASLTSTFTSVGATGSYNGSLTLNGGGTAYEGTFGSQVITFDLATGDLSFTAAAIPEPATAAALAATALLGFAACRRRRR